MIRSRTLALALLLGAAPLLSGCVVGAAVGIA